MVKKTLPQDVYITISEAANESYSTEVGVRQNCFFYSVPTGFLIKCFKDIDFRKFSSRKVEILRPVTLLKAELLYRQLLVEYISVAASASYRIIKT